jgi:predicted XRE-type DNA-binding protein
MTTAERDATTVERSATTVENIAHQAKIRQAQERLHRFDEMRNADELQQSGKTQREIADILGTTQPRVGRLLRGARALGDAQTPEELILRATIKRTSRKELVEQLSELDYTFTEFAPYPHEGSVPGTWTQVSTAHLLGLLNDEEYESVSSAVKPPPSE